MMARLNLVAAAADASRERLWHKAGIHIQPYCSSIGSIKLAILQLHLFKCNKAFNRGSQTFSLEHNYLSIFLLTTLWSSRWITRVG